MSLQLLRHQLNDMLATVETLQQRAAAEVISSSPDLPSATPKSAHDASSSVILVQRNRELEIEVEALRSWKVSASTIIQQLQQQLQQRTMMTNSDKAHAAEATQQQQVEAASMQSLDGQSTCDAVSVDESTAVFSPTTTDPVPAVASNDSTGSPTTASPLSDVPALSTRSSTPPLAVAGASRSITSEAFALQREALEAARERIKELEEALTIANARWAAADTVSQHHLGSQTFLSTISRTTVEGSLSMLATKEFPKPPSVVATPVEAPYVVRSRRPITVDSEVPNGFRYFVVGDHDALLNLANIACNVNKFYVIQLLQDSSDGTFWTWGRWGRVGEAGQSNLMQHESLAAAARGFCDKFKQKTGNEWVERNNFRPVHGKYMVIDC